jgi:hypothetical protein
MIKDSMRSADLCSLTASNPDRIKDPIHRDKWINAFPIMNLMTVHILGNGKKNRLSPRMMIMREVLRNAVYNGVSRPRPQLLSQIG